MPDVDTEFAAKKSHRAAFFGSWLRDPIGVASIAPSGRGLARIMARDVGPGARVIELGAGTGTLTEALLGNGVAPADLHLVEQNPRFVEILRQRFPGAAVHAVDAADIATHFRAMAGQTDFVVSGLPTIWLRHELKIGILRGAFELLAPHGRFHQFTYLRRPPVANGRLAALGLKVSLAGFAPLNMPPAFVYRFERA